MVYYIHDSIYKVLSTAKIDYIKWDMNRSITECGSAGWGPEHQGEIFHRYILGVYSLYERLTHEFPNILFESCASGGGRFDPGMFYYAPQCWTSDDSDGGERLRIQYGTSLFYPATVMGSHVSATPNHQTGNITPIKFRFDIACAGRLGMELQPKRMDDAEKRFARKAVASYKAYRDIVMEGDLYRIGTPYDDTGYYGMMYVSKDKKKAVLFTYCIRYQSRTLIPKFRLHGLDAKTRYTVREQNTNKKRFWFDGGTFTGEYLANAGINPNLSKIYDSAVFVLEAQ